MENLKSQIKFIQEIEVKEVMEEAEEQAKKIIMTAEEEAEKRRNQKTKDILERLQEKETSELEIAMLEQKREISNVRFQLLDEVMTEATATLKKMSDNFESKYKTSLRKLIVEAATKIQASNLEIVASSRDRDFIKDNLESFEKEVTQLRGASVTLKISGEELNTQGGAIVRDEGKKQIFNNTIEARLAKAKQEMLGQISVSLFEGLED